jgi:hypothetical protein
LLIALLLAVAACESVLPTLPLTNREGAKTLALPPDEEAFHFVVFGDRTGGPAEGIEVLAQAIEETNLLDPDLVMTVGDLVQGYNERPQWLEQMREYQETMGRLAMPWYPVAGNHDIYWRGGEVPRGQHEQDYEVHFGPLWYWFGHKNAAFVVLYSDEGNLETGDKGFRGSDLIRISDQQLAWLEATLSAARGYDHVFVFLHHPRWLTERYPDGNWDEVHRRLVAAGNVSAVFAGHIHRRHYDGIRDGITYMTLATIGGVMPMDVAGTGWLNHIDMVTVRARGFEVATIPVGAVLDPEAMTPEHLADIDRALALPIEGLTQELELRSGGEAGGEVRYRVLNGTLGRVEVSAFADDQAGDWRIRSRHQHLPLEPGESSEIAFQLQRPRDDFQEIFSIPRVVFQVDYLGEGRRVSLPERRRFVPLRPEPLPYPDGAPAKRQALTLDGQGGALWFAAEAIPGPAGPFTLEAWFLAEALDGNRTLIGRFAERGFALLLSGGRPRLLVGRSGKRLDLRGPDGLVEAGRWQHLAAVYDGTQARLYLDGALIAEADVDAQALRMESDLSLYVGANPDKDGAAGAFFHGALDEVRLSTVARYGGKGFDPPARHESDPKTLLLLHLDRDDGPFALDASPGRHHGIGVGTVSFVGR